MPQVTASTVEWVDFAMSCAMAPITRLSVPSRKMPAIRNAVSAWAGRPRAARGRAVVALIGKGLSRGSVFVLFSGPVRAGRCRHGCAPLAGALAERVGDVEAESLGSAIAQVDAELARLAQGEFDACPLAVVVDAAPVDLELDLVAGVGEGLIGAVYLQHAGEVAEQRAGLAGRLGVGGADAVGGEGGHEGRPLRQPLRAHELLDRGLRAEVDREHGLRFLSVGHFGHAEPVSSRGGSFRGEAGRSRAAQSRLDIWASEVCTTSRIGPGSRSQLAASSRSSTRESFQPR